MIRYGRPYRITYTEAVTWFGGLKSGPVPTIAEPPGMVALIWKTSCRYCGMLTFHALLVRSVLDNPVEKNPEICVDLDVNEESFPIIVATISTILICKYPRYKKYNFFPEMSYH